MDSFCYLVTMFRKFTFILFLKVALIGNVLVLNSCDSSPSSGSENITIADEISPIDQFSGLSYDPDFRPILERFIFEAEKRNVSVDLNNLTIFYGDIEGNYGVCFAENGLGNILISNDLRTETDDLLSEILLHELGHCVLGRDHTNNPFSIMQATNIFGEPWREEILNELFFGS